jgi:hypothetical protein
VFFLKGVAAKSAGSKQKNAQAEACVTKNEKRQQNAGATGTSRAFTQ